MQVPHIKITQAHYAKVWDFPMGGAVPTAVDICNRAIEIALAEQIGAQKIPHITIEQVAAMYPHVDKRDHLGILGKENSQIDAYNKANAEQEQYITADEARKLGAGNFEALCDDGKWRIGTQDCPYRETWRAEAVKYRAIKQPEPVEPTCQIKNLDDGVTETMTRAAAKLLQVETKDICDWRFTIGETSICISEVDNSSCDNGQFYSYKRKANLVKLDGKFMTREAAIALWESKKDTCDVWIKTGQDGHQDYAPLDNGADLEWVSHKINAVEYQLREKPKKQIIFKDVPVGVAVKPKADSVVWVLHGRNRIGQAVLSNRGSDTCDTFCAEFASLELAPAFAQPWIAVQEGQTGRGVTQVLQSKGFTTKLHSSYEKFIVTGIAQGYELK